MLDSTSNDDEVGNTEMLPWMILFGAIGSQPGELLTYQPTWHHGHAVMRFIPNQSAGPSTPEPPAKWKFEDAGGYQFGKHPDPAVYRLPNAIFDLRHSQESATAICRRTPKASESNIASTDKETEALGLLKDESIDVLRSLKSQPLVGAGAHPLQC